jgi:hypothetical protein
MKNNRFTSIFLVLVFLFSLNNYEANAKWVDKSDQLPGMYSNKEMTPYFVAAGVAVTGLVVFLVIKKNQRKKLESISFNSKSIETLGLAEFKKPTSLYNELNKAAEQSPVQFIAGCNNFENQKFCNKQVLSVGVRIRF